MQMVLTPLCQARRELDMLMQEAMMKTTEFEARICDVHKKINAAHKAGDPTAQAEAFAELTALETEYEKVIGVSGLSGRILELENKITELENGSV